MSQIKILFARLKINAERFRGFSTTRESPAGTRLAAAAEAAPTACTFRALGEPGGRRAIGGSGALGGKLLNRRRLQGRTADPELHHHEDRRNEPGKEERHRHGNDRNSFLNGGRKHQESDNRIDTVHDNNRGRRQIVVAKIVRPRWNLNKGTERVHSTWVSQKDIRFSCFYFLGFVSLSFQGSELTYALPAVFVTVFLITFFGTGMGSATASSSKGAGAGAAATLTAAAAFG